MSATPEIKNTVIPENLVQIPEIGTNEGVNNSLGNTPNASVQDSKGTNSPEKPNISDISPVAFSDSDEVKTVTLPDVQEKINKLADGSVDEASTWSANFFIRLIKRALHFSWKIIGK